MIATLSRQAGKLFPLLQIIRINLECISPRGMSGLSCPSFVLPVPVFVYQARDPCEPGKVVTIEPPGLGELTTGHHT